MAYAGSKRSKEEFPSEEEVTTVKSLQQQESVVNPAKVARTSWEADANVAGESGWKRGLQQAHQAHQASASQSLASPREFQISNPLTPPPPNTNSSCSSSANAQLNFQQRVMAAAALQEIRGIHPVSSPVSFKFPLDSSSSSNTLLEHLTLPPPLSPAMQVSSQRGLRDLDPVYNTSMLQNLPPIPPPVHAQVHQASVAQKMNGESLSSYTGILQQPMLQQVPLLPPAPGLLGRDPCAWFTSNLNVNNGGGGGGKENMLVPPLPPFQDVLSSLSGISALSPGLSSFQSPAEFLDHPPVQQTNLPSVSGMQQHAHAQQHLLNQQHQQQQQQQQQPSCSYRSDLTIPPPPTPTGEMMFSNGSGLQQNGFGSLCSTSSQIVGNLQRSCNYVNNNGNKVQQLMNGSTGPPNRVQQYSSLHLAGGGGGGGGVGGGVGCGGAGSSYCSSEMAASSVTSVHNAAASSSNTTMQNGSPEDTTTLAQRPQHSHPGTNSNNNKKQPPTRTYTKVYKLGSIGRAVDVTRFSNYTELRWELARMFNLEGQLDQKSGWQLVFIDHEGDILLVGDDPWEEFVTSVRGIRILSPSEVAFYTSNETGTPAPHSSLTSNGML